ncbi:glutathione S-transferase [Mycena alexandri]|uniref:glutathione transferase n=1 Tax=Mycena alexandri TaxID=1745969 RepID=A0AAD6XFL6_9AGAR|nr:glutathione S-transferase [Mycena alexandri]
MVLKLYAVSISTCTRRTATVFHELKVPFELIEVDWRNRAHKTAEFLEKQPFGQVPYLDDDGFIVYESRAICRYVAAKYPASGLIPADPKANALFEQAASVELTRFEPTGGKAGLAYYAQKMQGVAVDKAVIDPLMPVLDKTLEGYDAILGKSRYLAGDTLTLADLFHLPHISYVGLQGSDVMTKRPNVARWYNELIGRPSWLAYVDGVKSTLGY